MTALFAIPLYSRVAPFQYQRLCDEHNRWAEKGGRGRKKYRQLTAWAYLNKRGRGRPAKRASTKTRKPLVRVSRRSWAFAYDKEILLELIREAPRRPEITLRKLVREKVRMTDFKRDLKVYEEQHVNRIMRKIRSQLPVLHSPHRAYCERRS